jgi:hypothetical protein
MSTSADLPNSICGARLRAGGVCQAKAVVGKRRCHAHGGAPRSGAPKGNRNALRHGHYACGPELPQLYKFVRGNSAAERKRARERGLAIEVLKRDAEAIARGETARWTLADPAQDRSTIAAFVRGLSEMKDIILQQMHEGVGFRGDGGRHDALCAILRDPSFHHSSISLLVKVCAVFRDIGDGTRTRDRPRRAVDDVVGWRAICVELHQALRNRVTLPGDHDA